MVTTVAETSNDQTLGIARSPRSTWVWCSSTLQRDAVRQVLTAAGCGWWAATRYGNEVELATDVDIGWDALIATEALEAAGYALVDYDLNAEPAAP